jgi:hypothetical protein
VIGGGRLCVEAILARLDLLSGPTGGEAISGAGAIGAIISGSEALCSTALNVSLHGGGDVRGGGEASRGLYGYVLWGKKAIMSVA